MLSLAAIAGVRKTHIQAKPDEYLCDCAVHHSLINDAVLLHVVPSVEQKGSRIFRR